ncbi:hypothetical protein BGX30_007343, partial [Mortierella sp. GBA39]
YAFCNTHDVSNEAYGEAVAELSHKALGVHQSRSAATKQNGYYRGFGTKLVMFWIGSNGILVAAICSSVMEKKLTLTVSSFYSTSMLLNVDS